LLNKVVFVCFITLRLTQCSHVDYFNYVFITFLGLKSCNDTAAYGWFRKLSDFIKKHLNLCYKEVTGVWNDVRVSIINDRNTKY